MMPNSVSAGLGFYADSDDAYLQNAGTDLPKYRSVTPQDRVTL